MREKFESLVDHLIGGGFKLDEAVEILEKTLIIRVLERTGGKRTAAAKVLGIHRNTLQRKLQEYELDARRVGRKPVRGERAARRTKAAKAV